MIRLGVGVCMFGRGLAMEGPGLGCRGREASLLIPLVFVTVGRGGENLPVWGFPVHQKGAMAPGAQGCGLIRFAGKFNAGHVVRPAIGALYLSAVTARLYGPSMGACAG